MTPTTRPVTTRPVTTRPVMTRTVTPFTAVTATESVRPATGSHQGPAAPAPTVEELELAWQALRDGRFRPAQVAEAAPPPPPVGCPDGPVLVVAGVHGWSGTSTTALLLADAAIRRGELARVVDTAPPARSGFVAAAECESGVDETGRWRIGSRGQLVLQRPAHPFTGAPAVPAPMPAASGTVTVVDCAWPVHDLLTERLLGGHADVADDTHHAHHAHGWASNTWLRGVLLSVPLVLTARATIPGLRHLEHALDAVAASRDPAIPVAVALLGVRPFRGAAPRTLPRALAINAGPRTTACVQDQRLVLVPERPSLAEAGLTPAPVPTELHLAADLLLTLTLPAPAAGSGGKDGHGPGHRGRARSALQHLTHTTSTPSRKDTTS